MIPGLLEELCGVSLFGYITFRAVAAALTAFVLALVFGKPVIEWLRRHKVGEDTTKVDSKELADLTVKMGKKNTPTMGGSFLIASLVGSALLWGRLDNLHLVLGIFLTVGFAAVGFVDDYKKLTIPNCKGLTPKAKMLGLSIVAGGVIAALCYYALTTGRDTLLTLYPPFFKDVAFGLASMGVLGVLFFLFFQWLVVVGTSNACNITDGLDGLAAGCMLISGAALSVFCYVTGRPDWTGYLHLPHVSAASEMAVMGGALCGACMGFLWYNAFPAKVFMGDSGSLPLGGLLAWMAVVSKQELVLPLIGFVFFAELGSSWLQTRYFRASGGKRLFTCAPIHHGLQLKGGIFAPAAAPWHEVTIVVRAWIVAGICALAALALLKVR
jgi:phospho-N-acetylmuramoyl-pentapeptide-transferase